MDTGEEGHSKSTDFNSNMKSCPSEFPDLDLRTSDRCDLSWFEEDRPEFFKHTRYDPMFGQKPDSCGSVGVGSTFSPIQMQMLQHQQRLQMQRSMHQQQQMQQLHHYQSYQQQQQPQSPFPFQPLQFPHRQTSSTTSNNDVDFGSLSNAKLHKVLADHLPKNDLEQAVKLLRAILLQARPVKEQGRAKGTLTWPLPPCSTRPLPMLLELSDVSGALPWRERASEASLQASIAIYDSDPVQNSVVNLVGLSQNRQTTLIPLKCWQLDATFPNAEIPYNPSKHSFFVEIFNPGKHHSQPAKKVSVIGRLKQGGGPLRHEYCFSASGLRYSYEPDKLFWVDQLPESSVDGRVIVDLVNKTPLDTNLDPVCKIKPLFGFGRIEFNFILRQAGSYILQVSLELSGATPPSAMGVVSQLSRELGEGLMAEAYYSCETQGQVKLKQNATLTVATSETTKPALESFALKMKEQLSEVNGSPLAQWTQLHQVQMQLRNRPSPDDPRASTSISMPSTPPSPRSLNISISGAPSIPDNVRMHIMDHSGDASPRSPHSPNSPMSGSRAIESSVNSTTSSRPPTTTTPLMGPMTLGPGVTTMTTMGGLGEGTRSPSGLPPRFLHPPPSTSPTTGKRPRMQESSWTEERKVATREPPSPDPVHQLLQRLRLDSKVGNVSMAGDGAAVRRLTSADNSTLHLRSNGAWPSDCHVYFHFDRNTCVQASEMINPYRPEELVVCIPPIPRAVIETTISYINKAAQFNAKGVVLQPFVSANVVVATSPTITEPIYGYYTYPQSVLPPKSPDVRSSDDEEGDDDTDRKSVV